MASIHVYVHKQPHNTYFIYDIYNIFNGYNLFIILITKLVIYYHGNDNTI